jgi:N-acetylneuraminic acid mutarotase
LGRKIVLVAGAFGVTVSAAMKTLSAKAKIGLMLCLASLALPGLAAPWVQTTSLPDGYTGQSLAYSSGYLYQAGGVSLNNGFQDGTNVFYAQVHNDGTIGNWNSTTSLPEAVSYHAGVAANGFLYVLGGLHFTDDTGIFFTNTVYYSKINSDGSLGGWNIAAPLPQGLNQLSASVWNNTIYVACGSDGSLAMSNVYSAQIQSNGSLSSWTTQKSLPVATYTQAEAANGYLYVLGGILNNETVLQNVYYTKINADGTLAGWNQTIPLPQTESNFGAIAANGLIFSIAGYNGSTATTNLYISAVNGDGSLVAWSSESSLQIPIFDFAVVNNSSYIFLSGGQNNNGNALSSVYSMALPAPPAAPQFVSRSFTNGNFQLQLASSTNTGFGLLASTNLTSWTNIGWGFTGTNGLLSFQDTNAASFPNRFYRAYWPLP